MTTDPTAQPTPTPAPVAVPEGGWRDGDWIVATDGSDRRVAARGNGFWEWQSDTGGPLAIGMDSRVEEMFSAGRVIHIEAPRTLQTEPIHYAHHSDGYPLCWPQERDGEHEATREDGKVTCADCLAIIRSWDAEPAEVAAHAPRPEPVTAPLPSEAVEEAQRLLADAGFDETDTGYAIEALASLLDPGTIVVTDAAVRVAVDGARKAGFGTIGVRPARALLSAGLRHLLLPAADQRARDEETVRRAVLDAIEDPGRDDENPASRERIAGWRACAQDVRDALDSVEDDDEGTVREEPEEWPLSDGERRTPLHEPLRGTPPVNCRECGEEVEAYCLVTIKGLTAGYRWRHVADGTHECIPAARRVRPYDEYDAARRRDGSR